MKKLTRIPLLGGVQGLVTCLLLTAYCLLAYGQSTNTISNDGTTSPVWYIGETDSGAVGIGISQGTAPSNHLTLGDELRAGSQTFVSGWQAGSGWKIGWTDTTDYTLEIDNLIIRGTLSAQELLIDQIRATNGNLLVSSAAKVWYAFPSINTFAVEDVTGHGVAPFAVGDLIMCQVVNASGVTYDGSGDAVNNTYLIKRLTYKVDQVVGLFVYCSTLSGAPANKGTLSRGDTFVRFGNLTNVSRQGAIGLYADMPSSPYLRITDSVDSWSDWKSISKIKAQLGNLTGITDADFGGQLQGYGLYSNNAYMKGKIILTNPTQVADSIDKYLSNPWDSLNNKPTYFNAPSGAGLFLSATNMGYYNTTNYPADPWRTYMDNTGKFYLKGSSDEYLSWDGASLTIEGTINIKNPEDILASDITNDEGWITSGDLPAPGIQSYYQASAPTGTIPEGSIWIESDQLNSIYRYESSTWVEKIGQGTGIGTYIGSNGIYTGNIAADQVVAGTLTGFTIQTASSGQRVVLTSPNLTFYDASGQVGQIYGNSNQVLISGNGLNFTVSGGIFNFNNGDIVLQEALKVGSSNPATPQFVINNSGQITEVNDILASSVSGYVLVSDGTSFTPTSGYATQSWVGSQGYLTSVPSHQHTTQQVVLGVEIDGGGHVLNVEYGTVTAQ